MSETNRLLIRHLRPTRRQTKLMRYRYKKVIVTATLICAFACAPLSRVVATNATSIGAAELKKTIEAEKAQLAQLKKKLEPTPGIAHTLKRGSSGEEVRLLQQFLTLYSSSSAPVTTGFFGTLTKQAVLEFQQKESIDPVGIVGPKTRARILALSDYELAQEKARIASTSSEITNVIFGTEVGEDGSGVGSTTSVFASTTRNIYAILTLSNAKQDSEIGVIRYYKGAFVDSLVTHPSRSGLRYLHFQWTLKPGESRHTGPYNFAFYINGKKSKTTTFTIN